MAQDKRVKIKTFLQYSVLMIATIILMGCSNKDQEQKIYKIGILSGFDTFIDIANGFKSRMAESGYIEGKNIVYDLQMVNSNENKINQALEKFVREDIDLLLAFPTQAAIKAKAFLRNTDIPLVFAMAGVEGNHLIESIAKPGGNITGVRFPGPHTTVKRFELLHELMPEAQHLWVAYDPNYPTVPATLEALRLAVNTAGAILVEVPAASVEDIRQDLQARTKSGVTGIDAILIIPDLLTQQSEGWAVINQFAQEYKIPIAGAGRYDQGSRTVLSYYFDYLKIGRQAGSSAEKILKGTPAGTIMVATPQTRLRIDYKLALDLGLKVPEGLISKADVVVR
jgi:putative ABC transport system substrate-binding protein